MKTLQTKLLIGLLPTLAILVGLGLWAIVMFYRLGGNIDVILRENYTSILAAEGMKEAIERMDSGLLFAVGGRDKHGRDQFDANRPRFEEQLEDGKGNITVPGEQALADSVETLFHEYLEHADRFFSLNPRASNRGLFRRAVADLRQDPGGRRRVLVLNQENMTAMDRRARTNATNSIRLMVGALIAAVVLAVGAALAPEPIDLEADPGGHRRCAGDGARRARSARAGRVSRRARRPGQRVQRDGADPARVSPGRDGAAAPRRKPPRPRSTRFPIPWWSSIRSARSNRPIAALAGSWAWPPPPSPRFRGYRPNPCNP